MIVWLQCGKLRGEQHWPKNSLPIYIFLLFIIAILLEMVNV